MSKADLTLPLGVLLPIGVLCTIIGLFFFQDNKTIKYIFLFLGVILSTAVLIILRKRGLF